MSEFNRMENLCYFAKNPVDEKYFMQTGGIGASL